MAGLERLIIDMLLKFFSIEALNAFFKDPRNVAILVGGLVALSTATLGVFLVLRKMAMTADAISHTVLLGIVVAFLAMLALGQEPDISAPGLLIGAAAAGVGTVILTEVIARSGLVKGDTALGLAFPFLFAVAVILVTRYIPNVHLDTDAVMVGEIGIAWANTNSHCYDRCDPVTITAEDPRAKLGRHCVNCTPGGITPRSPDAQFETRCANCGTYTAAEAWGLRLIDAPPVLVFWPRALTPIGGIALVNVLFIGLLYKELKLGTFDSGLALATGFRPGLLGYALMVLVSLTAVAAFDAVGSVLVVAFFIVPAAAAYLITDRLSWMFLLAPLIGVFAAFTGYDLARALNISISAAMVIMLFGAFLAAWVLSPRYGLAVMTVRRALQRQNFRDQMLLGHLYNHQDGPESASECTADRLHEHLHWPPALIRRRLKRLAFWGLLEVQGGIARLTERGEARVRAFREAAFGG
jgi:manganese/zinc/iron transport system permease protein